LDFYSLLCATSICKTSTNDGSSAEKQGDDGHQDDYDEDEEIPTEMNFDCTLQLKNNALDGESYPLLYRDYIYIFCARCFLIGL